MPLKTIKAVQKLKYFPREHLLPKIKGYLRPKSA